MDTLSYVENLRNPQYGKTVETIFKSGIADAISKKFAPIESRSDLTPETFYSEYRQPGRPVVLRNYLKDWPALKLWNLDYLAEKCGSTPVLVNGYIKRLSVQLPFDEFIERLKESEQGSRHVYLQEWYYRRECRALDADLGKFALADYDFRPKLYGDSPDLAIRSLWIGRQKSITPLHQDAYYVDVLHAQLFGRKLWHVMAPEVAKEFASGQEPDLDRIMSASPGQVSHCTLSPGDVLYLPAQWFHRIELLENSIGLGMQVLDEKNLSRHMRARLQELLPLAFNAENIRENFPELYQIATTRYLTLARTLGIDLNRIR